MACVHFLFPDLKMTGSDMCLLGLCINLKVCVFGCPFQFLKQTSGFFQDTNRNIKMSGLGIHFLAGLCYVLCSKITISCVLLLSGPV